MEGVQSEKEGHHCRAPKEAGAVKQQQKGKMELAECKATLTKWCGPGLLPKRAQSAMCEIQVNGCQFDA